MSEVTHARIGLVQYLADGGVEATALAKYGEVLQPQVDLLARLIDPAAVVLQLGVGTGVHTLGLARVLTRGHLIAAEPSRVLRRILHGNVRRLGLTNVSILESVTDLANDTGWVDSLHMRRCSWIKIDRAEWTKAALQGAARTLWELRPNLWLAGRDDSEVRNHARVLADYGYRCWRHDVPYFNRANFNARAENVLGDKMATALLAFPEESDLKVAPAECVELS